MREVQDWVCGMVVAYYGYLCAVIGNGIGLLCVSVVLGIPCRVVWYYVGGIV